MNAQKLESTDVSRADSVAKDFLHDHQHIMSDAYSRKGDRTASSFSETLPQNDHSKHSDSKLLPNLEIGPFSQEATPKNADSNSFWDKMKGLLGHKETLGEQVHDKVLKDLKPDERKAFDEEEKKIKDHADALRRWGTSTIVPVPPCPEAPVTPMHNTVDRRTDAAEKKIADEVRASMSPEEQKRLDTQTEAYTSAMSEATKIKNPFGTGEGRGLKPEPGNALKDYWDRIREHANAYTS